MGRLSAGLIALCLAAAAHAQGEWSPKPWLEDLAVIRAAIETKYANRDWLAQVRQVDLDSIFVEAQGRIAAAGSDAVARATIDRMLRRFRDGHVEVSWPSGEPGSGAGVMSRPISICADLGFSARASTSVGPGLAGYAALPDDGAFAAGTFPLGRARLGILRIGEFQPQGNPGLCAAAERKLALADDAPCDDDCQNRLMDAVYADFTRRFADRLAALRAAGASALIVDITGNGGGSEWAEAAARMLTARPLRSEALGFVRGEHWVKHWREIGADLQDQLGEARGADRTQLQQWIAAAQAAEREAATPCRFGSDCSWLGRSGYATGLVGAAPASAFRGKPWGPTVFSPAEYDYADGIWAGPLIVLVNEESWSAAEEFAAVLQDNGAAIIMGARTGGAGCGHTDGGTPTRLPNSGGTLQLPDCARLRKDGSNEINGVIPDVLVPWRNFDSARRSAELLMPHLPEALARAQRR